MTILNFAAGIASAGPVRFAAYLVVLAVATACTVCVFNRLAAAFGGGEADTRNPNEVTR